MIETGEILSHTLNTGMKNAANITVKIFLIINKKQLTFTCFGLAFSSCLCADRCGSNPHDSFSTCWPYYESLSISHLFKKKGVGKCASLHSWLLLQDFRLPGDGLTFKKNW